MINVSSSEVVLFLAVVVSSFATFLTRVTPFYLMRDYKPRAWLEAVQKHMGLMIMIILVCYSLKDVKFYLYPYGISEILAVFVAIVIHLRFKNTLLSITLSTATYMFCIRFFNS